MFRCKNPECRRTFLIAGKLTIKRVPATRDFVNEVKRTLIEKAICPYCESLEFELTPEKKEG